MRLFAIGDLHLPSTRGKDMARFGWAEHPGPLARAWDEAVRPDDGVIVAGDISWATRPAEAADDLRWLDERPGQKVLLRGNHDYWWGDSGQKLRHLFEPYPSIKGFLHQSAAALGPYLIAGSRLWTTPEAPPAPGGELGYVEPRPERIQRELGRLALSFADAEAKQRSAAEPYIKVAAVHFPPLYSNRLPTAFSGAIEAFGPKVCVYGHLHGEGISAGFVGEHGGVRYVLASCDAAGFAPVLLLES